MGAAYDCDVAMLRRKQPAEEKGVRHRDEVKLSGAMSLGQSKRWPGRGSTPSSSARALQGL
jgi:hypothetical protein